MRLDVELALLVADGATMCHLTDDMSVTNGFQTIGSDHIAIEIHAFVLAFILCEGTNITPQQGQYDEQLFHDRDFVEKVTTICKRNNADFISLSFQYQFLQSIIPIFPKLPNHRLFEELPQRDALAFALALGGHAHAPFVVEDMGKAVFFQ